jgi:beta-galactosidase
MKKGNENLKMPGAISRRAFVRKGVMSASMLTALPILGCRSMKGQTAPSATGPSSWTVPLNDAWLFGGKLNPDALFPQFDDKGFVPVTLPHCATKLSWQNWDWKGWQEVWCYRRHFDLPETFKKQRVFLDFEGVMVGAEPTINGHTLPKHLGGYLPFHYEITDFVKDGQNVLALALDSRWSNVPPQGSPKGPQRVDYLEPGGIHRPVRLRAVPQIFIADVFAKPVQVLDDNRRLEILCTIDSKRVSDQPIELRVELKDGSNLVSRVQKTVQLESTGTKEVSLTLSDLKNIKLWDVDAPQLYNVVTTLLMAGKPIHDYYVRTGFRDAQFKLDGFFLNGRRLQIFGLDRHELYPYVGYAMPPRVKRRDAEILRREFHCNFVRCSHYPQSPAFLDACDELGLMVWQEVPGWGYLGDDTWKELLVRDVKEMIVRDRNRPSIVIWGTRANESANDVELYKKTKALAKSLDDSRPTSGSMTGGSRKNWKTEWHEDVFAFDDYHSAPDGTVGIEDPVPGFPYVLAEAVGQFNYTRGKNFDSYYRRSGDILAQQQQALRHAQAHSKAAANPRICGVVAWCGFEYGSLVNSYHNVKYPGVADIFRVPKLGASFYLTQGDPNVRPIIQPNFYWDFGPHTPRESLKNAAIFSNCDHLEVFINAKRHATLKPNSANYPHLKRPPFFVDLDVEGTGHPELRIDGFVGERLVLSRSFSSDSTQDRFWAKADDSKLIGDGVDATRFVFKITDKFGAPRVFAGGEVSFEVAGPGIIVGDNPFALADSGGIGAIWVKTIPNRPGRIALRARHSMLGTKSVEIRVERA